MSAKTASGKIFAGTVIIFLLVIISGGIIIWSRYEQDAPLEIHRPTSENWDGIIYIGGAINLPGYYPFRQEDSIETLVWAAGGTTDNFSFENIALLLDDSKDDRWIQKIDINRADRWLLEALPGIGEIIAQRIIDFRTDNGKFTSTLELLEVDGIGISIYERIKEYVTVSD